MLAHDNHLIGRDPELRAVEAFLGRSSAGALLIEGEAGIGKTALWDAAVRAGRDRNLTVLTSRPGEGESSISFASLADLLAPIADETLAGLPDPQRRALDAALLRESTRVPAKGDAVLFAVAGLLRALAGRAAVVIAIDDLQWLDAPTARALGFAYRRLGSEPVLFVATLRTGTRPPGPIETSLAGERTQHLPVGALSLGGLYRLVHDRLGIALARPSLIRVHEASGGNPLFALELARIIGAVAPDARTGRYLPLPKQLSDVLRDRLEQLDGTTRRALLIPAAMGSPGVAELLAAAGPGAADAIEAAERVGIIDTRDGMVRFTHQLLAAVVYDDSTATERRSIHAALANLATDVEERARHLALAATGPDEDVAAALLVASEYAERRGATDHAANLAEQALALTPAADRGAMFERAMVGGRLAAAAGDRSRARAMFERAEDHATSGAARAEALLGRAEISEPFGRGLDLCDRALREEDIDASLASRIHRIRGIISYSLGNVSDAGAHARTAVDLAETTDDPSVLGGALAELAHWTYCGGFGVKREIFERAVDLDDSCAAYSPRSHYAKILIDSDHFEEARPRVRALLDDALESGDIRAASLHLLHLAELELWSANWDDAFRLAEESLQLRRHTDEPGAPRYVQGMAAACLGRIDEARATAVAGLADAERIEDVVFLMQNLYVLGFVELSLGNYVAADVPLRRASELMEPRWSKCFGDSLFVPDELECAVALGDLERAEHLVEWMERVAADSGRALTQTHAKRSRALLHAARGDLDAAERSFVEALHAHDRIPVPFARARTVLALGSLQRRMKRRAAARATLEEAREVFERLGAVLWTGKADAEIARLGVRSEAQTGLTPVEERIAALVATGRTNKEIAETLSVSPKTVEANLSRIYRKLGIRSRAELGRLAAERDEPLTP